MKKESPLRKSQSRKWSQVYQGSMRPHFITRAHNSHTSSSNRVSDVSTGTNKNVNQGPASVEDDEERLAMKKDEMPHPFPKQVVNPRDREGQALREFCSSVTSDVTHTRTWFGYSRSVFPQSVRQRVQTLNFQSFRVASSSTIWVIQPEKSISETRKTDQAEYCVSATCSSNGRHLSCTTQTERVRPDGSRSRHPPNDVQKSCGGSTATRRSPLPTRA